MTCFLNCSNFLCLSQIIANQQTSVLSADKSDVFRISIRRKHVFEDALQFIKRGVPPHCYLRVTFVNEPAVDAGGPCREFLQLLIHSVMSNSMFFQGLMDAKVPTHNMSALLRDTFVYIGQMMAMSIMQGGSGPKCLAHPVVDYLLYGSYRHSSVSVSDIPDEDVKEKLSLVSSTQLQCVHENLICFG